MSSVLAKYKKQDAPKILEETKKVTKSVTKAKIEKVQEVKTEEISIKPLGEYF